jgi:hypothetical protein
VYGLAFDCFQGRVIYLVIKLWVQKLRPSFSRLPPCPPAAAPLQPLIPSREQQEEAGLPKPLLRYKDAEPLLGEDPRYERFPEEYR